MLYCVLTDRKNKDPNAEVDVIARAEDASKISRIVERFNLASVDTASIVTEAEKSKDAKDGQPEPDIGVQEKAEKDKLLDELMGSLSRRRKTPQPLGGKDRKIPSVRTYLRAAKEVREGATMTKEKPSVRRNCGKSRRAARSRKQRLALPTWTKAVLPTGRKVLTGKRSINSPQERKRNQNPKKRGKQL